MFWRRRLTNTAATRSRSSPRPVSFSTIEASTRASSARLERQLLLALPPGFLDHLAGFGLAYGRRRPGAAMPRCDDEGLWQQRPLGRHALDLAREVGVGLQALDDLMAREALRDRHPVGHGLALGQQVDIWLARLQLGFTAHSRRPGLRLCACQPSLGHRREKLHAPESWPAVNGPGGWSRHDAFAWRPAAMLLVVASATSGSPLSLAARGDLEHRSGCRTRRPPRRRRASAAARRSAGR